MRTRDVVSCTLSLPGPRRLSLAALAAASLWTTTAHAEWAIGDECVLQRAVTAGPSKTTRRSKPKALPSGARTRILELAGSEAALSDGTVRVTVASDELDSICVARPAAPVAPAITPPSVAAPPPMAKPSAYAGKTVLALDSAGIELAPELVAQFSEVLAAALQRISEPKIATNVELETLLDHAQQRELLGCTADRECLAEIARLAHSELLLTSTVGKVGSHYVVTLTLIDASNSAPLGKVSDVVAEPAGAGVTLERMARELLRTDGARDGFSLTTNGQTSFAVLDLAANGVDPATARNLTQVLSSAIKTAGGTSVISSDDVSAMLQLSETKAKMGCLDDTSCIAEIGGALGVQKLVVGTVGRLGPSHVVSLRLIDAKRVSVDARHTESFTGTEDQLIGAMRFATRKLLGVAVDGPGQLVVTASEADAAVFLNEESAGTLPRAPLTNLAAGQHRLRIEKPGYLLWQSDVYVEPNTTAAAWAQLVEVPDRWYQKWWVWAAVGTVVAGGVTATYLLTRDNAPDTDLPVVTLAR